MDDLGRGGRQIWRLFLDSNNDVRAPHEASENMPAMILSLPRLLAFLRKSRNELPTFYVLFTKLPSASFIVIKYAGKQTLATYASC